MIYRTRPFFREMVWGNERLNDMFSVPVGEYPVGEVWVLSGLEPNITPLIDPRGEETYPDPEIAGLNAPRFPLLVKIIAPSRWLSVQVHPDDGLAEELEGEPWGKNEGWYFVGEGKVAFGRSKRDVEKALKSGGWESVLEFIEVKDGDFVHIPAGTVHTLGPGSLVVEIQQSSDLTYRLYDWGRPREIHVEKALMAMKDVRVSDLVTRGMKRFECDHFVLELKNEGIVNGFGVLVFLDKGRIGDETFERFEVAVVGEGDRVGFQGKALSIALGRFWKRFRAR